MRALRLFAPTVPWQRNDVGPVPAITLSNSAGMGTSREQISQDRPQQHAGSNSRWRTSNHLPVLGLPTECRAIQKHCSNLKELHVVSNACHGLPHLLYGLSCQLTSLSLNYKPTLLDMRTIAMRCQGLRKLEFLFPDGANLDCTEKLLSAVGPGLEYVGVLGWISYPSFFRSVERHCRSLRAWKTGNFRHDLGHAVVDVIGSYSTHLEKLEIDDGHQSENGLHLSLSQHQEIVLKSPDVNAKVACRWDEGCCCHDRPGRSASLVASPFVLLTGPHGSPSDRVCKLFSSSRIQMYLQRG